MISVGTIFNNRRKVLKVRQRECKKRVQLHDVFSSNILMYCNSYNVLFCLIDWSMIISQNTCTITCVIIYTETILDCDWSISVQLIPSRSARICNSAKICNKSAKFCNDSVKFWNKLTSTNYHQKYIFFGVSKLFN